MLLLAFSTRYQKSKGGSTVKWQMFYFSFLFFAWNLGGQSPPPPPPLPSLPPCRVISLGISFIQTNNKRQPGYVFITTKLSVTKFEHSATKTTDREQNKSSQWDENLKCTHIRGKIVMGFIPFQVYQVPLCTCPHCSNHHAFGPFRCQLWIS